MTVRVCLRSGYLGPRLFTVVAAIRAGFALLCSVSVRVVGTVSSRSGTAVLLLP